MTRQRREQLCRAMAARGWTATAIVPGPSLYYLTGLSVHRSERLTIAFVLADGRLALLIPALEQSRVEAKQLPDSRLFPYADTDGPDAALQSLVQEMDLQNARLAVEFHGMWVGEERALLAAGSGIDLLPADEMLAHLRMTKDEAELAAMRRAVAIVEAALVETVAGLQPGQTERQVAADLQIALLRQGTESPPFQPIVVSGPNGALPHATPGDRRIRSGDVVTIDCGASWSGYVSDITRNLAVGAVDPDLLAIHQIVREANAAGRAAARPGVPAEEVDRAARDMIARAGYGDFFVHRTGHGLGLEIHEPPYIVEGNAEPLQVGMTFTIEPGIYVPGLGGVRIEDDVVITEDGSESLTRFPRELRTVAL